MSHKNRVLTFIPYFNSYKSLNNFKWKAIKKKKQYILNILSDKKK